MKKTDLHFDLPDDLVAQEPCAQPDQCRLMAIDRGSLTIEHRVFADLEHLVQPGDLLVLNRSKVLRAHFEVHRASGGQVPGLFVRQMDLGVWEVLLRSRGRLHEGDSLSLGQDHCMKLLSRGLRGVWTVKVDPPMPAEKVLEKVGKVPLPPYIRRAPQDARDAQDRQWYQTVYASDPGSVAAPTAGLHFTERLLDALRQRGVDLSYVTLHVGLGTFQPIEVEDLTTHPMHAESFELPAETVEKINRAKAAGRRVIAVGTTSVRVLESCCNSAGVLTPQSGATNIFIYPPYRFRCVDALITNFHLPGSTLLALVFALAGRDVVLDAYAEAVRQRYRFFSYGDAMFIQ